MVNDRNGSLVFVLTSPVRFQVSFPSFVSMATGFGAWGPPKSKSLLGSLGSTTTPLRLFSDADGVKVKKNAEVLYSWPDPDPDSNITKTS